MTNGYKATLKGGEKIYIADWLPTVALENLTQAGKYIGIDNLLNISKLDEFSEHTTILAISSAEEAKTTMNLVKHFVCAANMDGVRIEESNFDEVFKQKLGLVIEIFVHVVHSQYAGFFGQGLVEVQSPPQ